MEKVMLVISSILSCLIVVHIVMQHMNDKYEKRIRWKNIYVVFEGLVVLLMTMINLFGNPT